MKSLNIVKYVFVLGFLGIVGTNSNIDAVDYPDYATILQWLGVAPGARLTDAQRSDIKTVAMNQIEQGVNATPPDVNDVVGGVNKLSEINVLETFDMLVDGNALSRESLADLGFSPADIAKIGVAAGLDENTANVYAKQGFVEGSEFDLAVKHLEQAVPNGDLADTVSAFKVMASKQDDPRYDIIKDMLTEEGSNLRGEILKQFNASDLQEIGKAAGLSDTEVQSLVNRKAELEGASALEDTLEESGEDLTPTQTEAIQSVVEGIQSRDPVKVTDGLRSLATESPEITKSLFENGDLLDLNIVSSTFGIADAGQIAVAGGLTPSEAATYLKGNYTGSTSGDGPPTGKTSGPSDGPGDDPSTGTPPSGQEGSKAYQQGVSEYAKELTSTEAATNELSNLRSSYQKAEAYVESILGVATKQELANAEEAREQAAEEYNEALEAAKQNFPDDDWGDPIGE